MAGPTAGVLLRAALSGKEAAALSTWLGEVFEPHDDLWLLRKPAMIGARQESIAAGSFCVERESWVDDPDFPDLPRMIGYRPAEEVVLYAMVNGRDNHLVLGRLWLTLARRFDALIDFGGALEPGDRPPGVPYLEPDAQQSERLLTNIHSAVQALPGTVHELHYQTARHTPWVSHIGDAEFHAAWLNHSHFHMIK